MEMKIDENGYPFVMWGENKIGLEKQPVTEKFFTEKAARELRETPEVVDQALRELRDLIKGEPALYVPSDNDEFLKRFLRPCKFYANSAFKRIQAYYKFRQGHVEYCEHLVPSVVQSVFQRSIISILAPRDQHGRRIMLVDSEKWNPRDVSLPEVFRGVQLSLEAAMEEPRTQISGVNVILDMAGLTFSQIMQFTPFFAKLIIDWIQDCIPIRLKAVHIVNQPYIFKMLFAIFKPFMREKLRSRIHFHGSDRASLLAHIDGKALRKRHGGNLPEPEVSGDISWKMFSHFEDNFKLFNSYGYISNNNK